MRHVVAVFAALAGIYLIFTYWSRADYERRQARAVQAQQRYRQSVSSSSGLKLVHFYASPAEIVTGEKAIVCYGVENAVAVRLEPPVEEVRPVLNRCFSIAPEKTTTYHFSATGKNGEEVSAEFTLPVNPAPPFITMFATSERKIRRGEFFTICYGVEHATSVLLQPLGLNLPAVPKNCVKTVPAVSMKFTLIAQGAQGMTHKQTAQVVVQ
jgi:hypothetical protein